MENEIGLSYKEILMDGMQNFVFVIKINPNFEEFYFQFLNRAAMSATGLGNDIIGKSVDEMYEKNRATFLNEKFSEVATSGKAIEYQDSFMSPTGRTYYTQTKLTPIFDHQSRSCTHIIVSAKDITEERIIKLQHQISNEKLIESENRLRIITENAHDLISLLNREKRYIYTSPSYKKILGSDHQSYIGISFLETIHPNHRTTVDDLLNHSIEKKEACTFQVQQMHRTNGWIWLEVCATPVFNDKDKLIHFVMVARDITIKKEYEAKLKHLALHDVLTGLPNRLQFNKRLHEAMENYERKEEKFAVLMVDIDNFKSINDTYGHDAGDIVIEKFSHILRICIRHHDLAARLGGDEFAILLCHLQENEDAIKVAKLISNVLQEPIVINQHAIHITASIGTAVASEETINEQSILKHADIALYEAKNAGKNRFYMKDMLPS